MTAAGRRRLAPAVLLVAGLGAAVLLGRAAPRDQTVRIVLGDRAPGVTDVAVRYRDGEGDLAREVHFAFDAGVAPRVVTHAPRLPDGAYTLEIEVRSGENATTTTRRATLGGGTLAVDVARP